MNWIRKLGLKQRLFVVIMLIVLVNFLALTLFGSAIFRKLYYAEKTVELSKNADQIQNSFQNIPADKVQSKGSEEWKVFFQQLRQIEKKNNTVTIFTISEDNEVECLYHTWVRFRPQETAVTPPETSSPPLGNPASPPEESEKTGTSQKKPDEEQKKGEKGGRFWFPNVSSKLNISQWILDDPPEVGEKIQMESNTPDGRGGNIMVVSGLGNQAYLLLETPKDYLAFVAQRAVYYTALQSMIIFLCGSVLIYFLVARFTKPITEVQETAERIANLDFSRRCEVRTDDEVGSLARSINQMADKLEGSIVSMKQANQTLQTDLERQQQTDRIRREFISNVSHDFKTPITLVVSYAEALKATSDPKVQEEYCDVLIDEGNRLSRIVNRMLQLSRLECGMNPLNRSVFCLNEILDDTIHQYRIMAEKKCQTIETHYCDEMVVRADFQQIQQVFANILENAVKYAGEGRKIRVITRMADGRCRIEVQNEGSYIQPDELPRVFDSFYRANKAREQASMSYGIGLAIVKAILEQHGQQYGAYNTDSGVCFWFTLESVIFEDEDEEDAEDVEEII